MFGFNHRKLVGCSEFAFKMRQKSGEESLRL